MAGMAGNLEKFARGNRAEGVSRRVSAAALGIALLQRG
jgi:hypothetical protein